MNLQRLAHSQQGCGGTAAIVCDRLVWAAAPRDLDRHLQLPALVRRPMPALVTPISLGFKTDE
jgi:hypothetical protein